MIRRPPRSTRVRSSAASDVYKRQEFRGEDVIVNPLRIHPETINELEYNLLLCFTGKTRVSDHITDDQVGRYQSQESSTVDCLERQKELATAMKDALLQ